MTVHPLVIYLNIIKRCSIVNMRNIQFVPLNFIIIVAVRLSGHKSLNLIIS